MTSLNPSSRSYTLEEDEVYSLPRLVCLFTAVTAAGTIEVSNDGSNWQAITLDANKNFYTAASFLRVVDDDATLTVNAHTILPGNGSTFLRQVVTRLNDTEIKALPTTAINLIDAPGAGKIIIPTLIYPRLSNWIADYTNIDATCVISFPNGNSNVMSTIDESITSGASGLLAGGGPDGTSGPVLFNAKPSGANIYSYAGQSYDSDLANLPLKISVSNGGAGDFTGGDTGNILTITVAYYLLDMASGYFI